MKKSRPRLSPTIPRLRERGKIAVHYGFTSEKEKKQKTKKEKHEDTTELAAAATSAPKKEKTEAFDDETVAGVHTDPYLA